MYQIIEIIDFLLLLNHISPYCTVFYIFAEIVNTAIGEVTKIAEINKNVIHGSHSAGVSATSGSVIDEIEGWGDLWKLKGEGEICYVRTQIESNLILCLQYLILLLLHITLSCVSWYSAFSLDLALTF